ncbi:MAG: hypothetical protein OXN89_12080 [Bryobacterales bacterium]|nr:hypothetical protein [Bryobacterales bacterium]
MNIYSIVGLILDLIGVLLLGADVVRLQRTNRRRANQGRASLDEIESVYGGIESWTNEIKKQSEWIPESAYSRHHSEDEVSYNAHHALDNLRDISSAVNGLAERVTKVSMILHNNAIQDERIASISYRLSIVGLVCLVFGFLFQIFGALTLSK